MKHKTPKILIGLAILIFIHALILLNLQFTAWPEMLSYPFLLSKGFKLYKDIALPYPPLLPLFEALYFGIFKYNLVHLRVLTFLVILLSDLLIAYTSFKNIKDKILVFVPLGIYICLQPLMEGNMLWFDLATIPLILAGLTAYLVLEGGKRIFWLGFFLSLAFFIKQQIGIVVILVSLFFLLSAFRKLLLFLVGFSLPAAAILLYIVNNNILRDFIFWTVNVPLFSYPKYPGYPHLPGRIEILIVLLLFIPVLMLLKTKNLSTNLKLSLLVLTGLFITSFPRFEFFRFQPVIAVYIICLILILKSIKNSKKLIFLAPFFVIIFTMLIRLNLSKFNQETRFYGDKENRYVNIIKSLVRDKNKIYLIGESSTLYVLSGLLPSRPWVDNYGWYMEIPGIQEKVISGFINDNPEFILRRIPASGNWFDLGVYQPVQVISFIEQNYKKISIIDKETEIWQKKN